MPKIGPSDPHALSNRRYFDKSPFDNPYKHHIYCMLCHTNLTDDYYGVSRIKNQNICLECYIKKEKPYELKLYDYCNDPCGGSDIYEVIPKVPTIRLHSMVHFEYHLRKIRTSSDFKPVGSWENIWKEMHGWINPKWEDKFKGPLKKGIYEFDGNGMIAFVEDLNGKFYYVNGVYG